MAAHSEALQGSTERPTTFEIVLLRIEDQKLLMATPCTPLHVRFKSDLTLVDGLCTEATVLKVDEDRFFQLSA